MEARVAAPGTELNAEVYYTKEITQAKMDVTATVVAPRFYQPDHRRA